MPTGLPQPIRKGAPILDTNLRHSLEIPNGNPRALDTDFPATVNAFPHIGSATVDGDRVITNFGEVTGYDVRGR